MSTSFAVRSRIKAMLNCVQDLQNCGHRFPVLLECNNTMTVAETGDLVSDKFCRHHVRDVTLMHHVTMQVCCIAVFGMVFKHVAILNNAAKLTDDDYCMLCNVTDKLQFPVCCMPYVYIFA